jgi:hypothetical protein
LAKSKEREVDQKAKAKAKEQKLSATEENALIQQMRSDELSQREQRVIETGISNLEFHYLGSAKILGGVGKGMAQAMSELRTSKNKK